ncbi:transposase [Chryseobacterium tongliaoense]|uniref:transposase n=1 Tax=Chryseobacterium tongliaoense TaxID=3240933 RepID=UPI003517F14F
MDFKNIHIGSFVKKRCTECEISPLVISKFFGTSVTEIEKMYQQENMSTDILLKWSKLLKYDFFRIYTQHLILYCPPNKEHDYKKRNPLLPKFRKNIYTIEIINYILQKIEEGEMTPAKVIAHYGIPKTTLYKWSQKYGNNIISLKQHKV